MRSFVEELRSSRLFLCISSNLVCLSPRNTRIHGQETYTARNDVPEHVKGYTFLQKMDCGCQNSSTCDLNNPAKLSRVPATFGWSEPNACSKMARAFVKCFSASSNLPWYEKEKGDDSVTEEM